MNTATVTTMHNKYQTVSGWITERAAVKARAAHMIATRKRDWAHISALIARAAIEDAAK